MGNSRSTQHAPLFTFHVLRFTPGDPGPHYQDYSLDVPPGLSVLEALVRIQTEQDGTLAFRYACRGAVCGSCGMVVNGREDLACRVLVHHVGQQPLTAYEGVQREAVEVPPGATPVITVEPLRNLQVIRDLVVDIEPFLAKVRALQPWLQPEGPDPERERLVPPEQWGEAEPYTNCIMCACCHSVCPAEAKDPLYVGPAALAKHYRFLADPRDAAAETRLARVDNQAGVWGCEMVSNCVKICPKGVPPTKGIGRTRARLKRKT
jgi:succinate dehydrogenase / fumarate reductase iron-sulfur subunit